MNKVDIYDFQRRLEQAMDKLRKDTIGNENIRDIETFSKIKLAKGVSPEEPPRLFIAFDCWQNGLENHSERRQKTI